MDVSVLGTVRDHSALRTRSQGQSMVCPVQWGPHGTHRVQFTRPIDTIEHRASKMLPRARTGPAGRVRGRYTIGSAERLAGLFFDFGMVVPPHVMAEVLFL